MDDRALLTIIGDLEVSRRVLDGQVAALAEKAARTDLLEHRLAAIERAAEKGIDAVRAVLSTEPVQASSEGTP